MAMRAVLAAVLVAAASPALAQTGVRGAPNAPPPGGAALEAHAVRLGDRVRAWRTDASTPVEGPVVAASYSAITIVSEGRAELVPFPSLARLEVRHVRSRARRGALVGLVAGLLLSLNVVTDEALGTHLDTGERIAGTAAMGALGAGAGALVGSFVRTGGWQAVTLPTPPAASGPGADGRPPGGLRAAVRIRF